MKLDEPCIERGDATKNGLMASQESRGLLAHIFDTTMPRGAKIICCHACHNKKCSNPNHLYWGTAKENNEDALANGGKTYWEKIVAKYGNEGAKQLMSANAKSAWEKRKRNQVV